MLFSGVALTFGKLAVKYLQLVVGRKQESQHIASNYNILENEEGYRPAPYLASRGMKWIQKYDNHKENDEELKYYIEQSYHIVSMGLTKKKQKELGLTPGVAT